MKRTKIKQVKKTLKNDDLINMFNQMVGEGDLNMEIATRKYELILSKFELLSDLMERVFTSENLPLYVSENYSSATNNFIDFAHEIRKELHECTLNSKMGKVSKERMQKLNQNQEEFFKYVEETNNKYDKDELKEVYFRLKNGDIMNSIIVAVRDIKKVLVESDNESHDLEDKMDLKMDFILNHKSANLALMPSISLLDFKMLCIDDAISDKFKMRILLFCHLFYKNAMIVLDQISKPDINIADFSSAFITNIENIKNIPELKGCTKAFNKICSSVDLLENNFDNYYKEFVANKNPGSIIENFVLDVATGSNVDLSTTMQFKKIISYYKSKMAGKVDDPRISSMLDMVSKNIELLEE